MAAKKQPTKADLVEENTILKEQNDVLAEKLETLEEMIDAKMAKFQDQLAASKEAGKNIEPEVEMLRDPFDGQHPHKILADPPGFKLGWKNEAYRSKRGMRGWVHVMHDDEVGRELDKYLQDPPQKMEGSDQLDNKVRRGDSVLCKLPVELWEARQRKRVDKDAARRNVANDSKNRELMPGVTTFGKGQTPDSTAKR